MAVDPDTAREHAEIDGVRYVFCGPGCRRRFELDPSSYAGAASQ
jgi:YHS domain-containing protein